ncbi:exosome complex exonuclease Rrp41 [Candidatus Micrarchaeota archaeon]|nr:exosome complex exonuclease Rrp41 [Candidatus Micrarchaeota archaeon]
MSEEVKLIVDGKRRDGRALDELRPLKIEAGVLHEADGSALVHWGGNKVIAGVFGPRECLPKHEANPYKALVKCRYTMSPFASKEEHSRSGPNRRSIEISKVIRQVFESLVVSELYPMTQIDIYVDVLQAEGGTRASAITAAAVALADAGIPMKDMACGLAVGKAEDQIILDLGKEEDNSGQSDVPIAISHRDKKFLLLQMDGLLSRDELEQALDMGIVASDKIHELQVDAITRRYSNLESDGVEL